MGKKATTAPAKAKAPVAKPAIKAAAKRFKKGTEGSFVRRNGEKLSGKVKGFEESTNGAWLLVHVDSIGVSKIRPSQFQVVEARP